MDVVRENEKGENEVEREDALEPRRHLLVEDVFVGRPRDPKESDGQPRAEDIVAVPEEVLERHVEGGREEARHAVELPEEQHGGEQQHGAPRAAVQHALPERAAPKHGDGECQDEQEEAVVA